MNKEGAIAGMIAGIGFTFSYIVYFQFMGGTSDQYFLGITPEGIGFIGMIINFIISFLVCRFTSSPPEDVIEMVEEIHIPTK